MKGTVCMYFFRFSVLAIGVVALTLGAIAASQAQVKAETDKDKTLYAFGYAIAGQWRPYGFSEAELKIMTQGIIDAVLRRDPQARPEDWNSKIQPLLTQKRREVRAIQQAASAKLLAKEAQAPGAKTMPSGLIITELKPGAGASPKATSKVTVHYHGTLGDGTVFDSSVRRGEPATFPLDRVINCWTEGLQLMKIGGKSRLVCPANLAYGDGGSGGEILPATALIFEVELLKIN